jgi:diaminopropionate ammonia-lyase
MQAGRLVSLSEPQDSGMAGLNCATPSPVAWPDVEHGFAAYVAVDDARVPAALRLLDEDGVQSGETGAAALAGLLLVAECSPRLLGPAAHVLTLCTEGPTDPAARARLLE